MHIDWQNIVNLAVVAALFIIRYVNKIEKKIAPILEQVEKAARDGKIDKKERKSIAVSLINDYISSKKIKVNFIGRAVIGWIVDMVASKLPDFNISQTAQKDIGELIDEVKKPA